MVPDRQRLRNGGDLRSAAKSKLRGPQPSSWGQRNADCWCLLWCSAVHGYCAPPMQHQHTPFIHFHPFTVPKLSWQVNDTKEESWQNILDSNSYSALAQVFCYSEDLYGNLKYSQTAPLTVKTTDSWTPNWAMRLATDDPFTFPRKDKDGKWTPEINTNHHLRFLILMRIIWPPANHIEISKSIHQASTVCTVWNLRTPRHQSFRFITSIRWTCQSPSKWARSWDDLSLQNAGRWDLGHRDHWWPLATLHLRLKNE